MKQIIATILFIISLSVFSYSQSIMTQTDPAGASASVNTNADTSYHTLDLGGQVNNFKYFTIAVKGTKTSGTVAGTVIVQGSMDNSRWFTLTDTTGSSSQSLTDGDNDKKFEFMGTRWRYYRVRVITTGTQVSAYLARLLGRKESYN